MTASELRIGNWINDFGDGYGQVLAIDPDHYILTTANEVPQPIATFSPIKITPDWLIRAGFIKDVRKYYSLGHEAEYNVYTIDLFTYNVVQGAWWYNGGVLHNQPQYVHQLQNLYYALTGKELDFKPGTGGI